MSLCDDPSEGIEAFRFLKTMSQVKNVLIGSYWSVGLNTIEDKEIPIDLRVVNGELQMHFHESGVFNDSEILPKQYVPLKNELATVKISGFSIVMFSLT